MPSIPIPASAVCRGLLAASIALGLATSVSAADATPAKAELHYTADILSDVEGGLRRGTGVLGRFDLVLDRTVDVAGLPDVDVHFDLMALHGARYSTHFAGDAQTLSNIDAPRAIRPFEAWLQLPLTPHLRAKAGFIDLNSEFDVQSVGAVFLNSSFGIAPDFSQSGLNGPSIFPVTSPGLVIAAQGRPNQSLALGVFDALPGDPDHGHRFLPGPLGRDGALLVAEAGFPVLGAGALQVGGWRYTSRFDRIDGRGRGSSGGAYALLEGTLAGGEARALRAWVRVGVARGGVDPIGVYAGGGMTYGNDDRLIGLAVAHARLASPALRSGLGDRRAETAIEWTGYRRINALVAIQPDVQYVIHPAWRSAVADALTIGLRLHISYVYR